MHRVIALRILSIAGLVAVAAYAVSPILSGTIKQTSAQRSELGKREEAYRANNVGVALLEQFKYKEAAESFRRALELDRGLAIARVNLAIALYNVPDLPGSLREARAAADAVPAVRQPHYIMGLIARSENRTDDAILSFRRVLEVDARDVGANVNIGQLYAGQRKYDDAIKVLRTALEAEPYNVTATYNLGLALLRSGKREEGQQLMQRFQALREAGYGTVIGQNYLEQGTYAEAIVSTGAEPELVNPETPEVTYIDASASFFPQAKPEAETGPHPFGQVFTAGELVEEKKREIATALAGGITLFDFDGDGDLDLCEVTRSGQRLYRNDGGKFVEVTKEAGLASSRPGAIGMAAIAGDYDNDGYPDLFVLRYGGSSLYRNQGNGTFTDVTAAAEIPDYAHLALSAALVDVDHDGDLDIFIAGFVDLTRMPGGDQTRRLTFPDDFAAAPNLLLRNNGNGKFTDVTAAAGLSGTGQGLAIVPTDYDNRRDVDLLVLNYTGPPALFGNQRDGSFRNLAAEVGLDLPGKFTCVAATDFNKDGYTDFFFGRPDEAGIFALSDGKGRFAVSAAPAGSESAQAAQFLDYDNDGLIDLVLVSTTGPVVLRNVGTRWENTGERAVSPALKRAPLVSSARGVASGDIDGDGDTDLVLMRPGHLMAVRNEGGNRNQSMRVNLVGKVGNRSGVGAKIELRAGSLKQKLETYAASPAPAPADVIFGLGQRQGIDAVRVLWPAGIIQAEIEIAGPAATARTLTVTELDRKPSSCPYLFAWNGERFEFISDFLGGGEMGYSFAPGVYNQPDPDEYVRIRGDQLKPRNGRFEIRITNELEEALYLDRLQLLAIAHPSDLEVYPNEGLTGPPYPSFRPYVTRDARLPARAFDDRGRDVLPLISRVDRQYAAGFRTLPIRGYAEEHVLVLDLGDGGKQDTLLLLTGWTDYAFSSDNIAAHQSGLSLKPPALQVRDGSGTWQTAIENIGIPVGRPQTVVVDLAGKFLSDSREVRLVTNMRIYWDQILVATNAGNAPRTITRLDPIAARLTWRGYSAETTPDGKEPYGYEYERVTFASPWKVMPGRYTREGDVRELLLEVDDMFVVSRTGDEIAVAFDSGALKPLPRGWSYTYLLYADGYSKEMDINSASPDQVAPLPFHAMKSYPYSPPATYPQTPAHRRYIETYNTRIVAAPVPRIETVFADEFAAPAAAASSSARVRR